MRPMWRDLWLVPGVQLVLLAWPLLLLLPLFGHALAGAAGALLGAVLLVGFSMGFVALALWYVLTWVVYLLQWRWLRSICPYCAMRLSGLCRCKGGHEVPPMIYVPSGLAMKGCPACGADCEVRCSTAQCPGQNGVGRFAGLEGHAMVLLPASVGSVPPAEGVTAGSSSSTLVVGEPLEGGRGGVIQGYVTGTVRAVALFQIDSSDFGGDNLARREWWSVDLGWIEEGANPKARQVLNQFDDTSGLTLLDGMSRAELKRFLDDFCAGNDWKAVFDRDPWRRPIMDSKREEGTPMAQHLEPPAGPAPGGGGSERQEGTPMAQFLQSGPPLRYRDDKVYKDACGEAAKQLVEETKKHLRDAPRGPWRERLERRLERINEGYTRVLETGVHPVAARVRHDAGALVRVFRGLIIIWGGFRVRERSFAVPGDAEEWKPLADGTPDPRQLTDAELLEVWFDVMIVLRHRSKFAPLVKQAQDWFDQAWPRVSELTREFIDRHGFNGSDRAIPMALVERHTPEQRKDGQAERLQDIAPRFGLTPATLSTRLNGLAARIREHFNESDETNGREP